MAKSQWLQCIVYVCLFACNDGSRALHVKLTIEPSVVELNQTAVLHCTYDLRNASLYSVKWYRGAHEFYRYTPREHPDTKIFHVQGIHIDLHESNSTQVVLRKIDFRMSGEFSCEVTTDEAPVSTGQDSKHLTVVQLPPSPPTISVGRDPLDYGDVLRANCSSPPSRPPAFLTFSLNNITVARSERNELKSQESAWSDLMLDMKLSEYHFLDGRLRLSCRAEVIGIYNKEAVLELESARHPVPERVHADTGSFLVAPSFCKVFLIFSWLYFLNT